jgi:drug/metabolite transporter (DMT)-like permease
MTSIALGITSACAASTLYNVAVALQAVEARTVASEHRFRLSLITQLLRRVRWVSGMVLGIAAWTLQTLALFLAPITVVQPSLAAGLFLLLFIGARTLGESVRFKDLVALCAIVVGVAGLAWVAPEHSSSHATTEVLAPTLVVLGILAVLPLAFSFTRHRGATTGYLAAVGAGLAYAWSSLSTKFMTDDFFSTGVFVVLAWAVATALAAGVGLLSETTSLQTRPASRAAPIIFVVQTVVPVLAAPLLAAEHWKSGSGALAVLFVSLVFVLAGAGAVTSSQTLTTFQTASKGQTTPDDKQA